jgi:hypothetical protein
MQKDIFDADKEAKVVVYIGANHVSECETDDFIYWHTKKRKPLGLFLEEYTKGRNLSVYMGHTYDTPAGCDLFISDFIWNTYSIVNNEKYNKSCNLVDNAFDIKGL